MVWSTSNLLGPDLGAERLVLLVASVLTRKNHALGLAFSPNLRAHFRRASAAAAPHRPKYPPGRETEGSIA
jgi:hypothetical protein